MPKPNTLMTAEQRNEYIAWLYNNKPTKEDFEDVMQINNLVAAKWERRAKRSTLYIILAFLAGLVIGYNATGDHYTQRDVNDIIAVNEEICERKLNDPHHCLSVCEQAWKNMGN